MCGTDRRGLRGRLARASRPLANPDHLRENRKRDLSQPPVLSLDWQASPPGRPCILGRPFLPYGRAGDWGSHAGAGPPALLKSGPSYYRDLRVRWHAVDRSAGKSLIVRPRRGGILSGTHSEFSTRFQDAMRARMSFGSLISSSKTDR
jgi:hypothetical protein